VIPTRREWIERERRREIHHCHFRLTITGDHVGPLAPAIAGGHERQSNENQERQKGFAHLELSRASLATIFFKLAA